MAKPTKKDPPQIDGVLIQLIPTEKGDSLAVEALGGVKVRELPTLLRQAARSVEDQLEV